MTVSLAQQIQAGDRRALARGITLVESTRADHRQQASELLEHIMPATGNSLRLGISGAPGVGKSTFIEALGNDLTERNHRVAVLAVDPTSTLSGGSILGDKTRMEMLAVNTNAFVRPTPAGKTLGGVARYTREALLLCEAAGFDCIIIETVGVGQSETMVAQMTDMFLLLLSPGGGDDLQGIKRGIMELTDLLLVNKADGDQVAIAKQTVSDYQAALQFMQPRSEYWKPQVVSCSALKKQGLDTVIELIGDFQKALSNSGQLADIRAEQARAWMWSETAQILISDLKDHTAIKSLLVELEKAVLKGDIPPTVAAERLISHYKGQYKNQ